METTERPTVDELVERGLAMADRMGSCKAHQIGRPELVDELVSAARLGLVQAARSFNPDRGATFKTWAWSRIQGAIIDELRTIGRRGFGGVGKAARDGKALPDPLLFSKELAWLDEWHEPLTVEEIVPSPDLPVGWELEYEDEVEGLARRTGTRLDGDVIRCMYQWADTRKMKDTAKFLGVSESRISHLHARAAETLAEVLT